MNWTIGELARAAGVSRRTIRYYVEIGLLPPPEGAGRAALYRQEHLERLNWIRALQEHRLSLEEIRAQLAVKPSVAGESRWMLASVDLSAPAVPGASSAADYLAALRTSRPAPPPAAARAVGPAQPPSYEAEQWLRISLSPDVELHVRRRGSRLDRRVAHLVREARRIFEEEEQR